MEVIKRGSDKISKVETLGCCWPPGTEGYRNSGG